MTILQKLKDKLHIYTKRGKFIIEPKQEEPKVEKHYCSTCRYLVDRGGEPTGNPYQHYVLVIHECCHPNNIFIRQWEDYMGTYNYSVCVKIPADLNNHGQCQWWEEKEKK